MSAYGSRETAIEAMRLGAYDYISKPFNADEVLLAIRKAEERETLQREVRRLRANPVVRLLHLAGRAPMPQTFEMDDVRPTY